MRTGSLLFLAGILLLVRFRELPPPYLLLILPICIFLVWKSRWLRWPAVLMSGFLWALLRADGILSERLKPEQEGKNLVIEGEVIGLPLIRNNGTRFDFRILRLTDNKGLEKPTPAITRLTWYRGFPSLEPGEQWRLAVRLKRPRGYLNPGGFDYEGWLFQQRIGATGYVLADNSENRRIRPASGISVHRLRFLLGRHLKDYIDTNPAGVLIPALVIGDRSGLSSEQWRVLIHTGTSHLLAISGLHIGIVAGLGYFITRYIWPWTGLLVLGLATPRAAALVSISVAIAYAALAGFAIPTQRALIMLGVVLSMLFFYRRTGSGHVIAMALILILIIDPFTVMSAGFWLSFSAIIMILYGMDHRTGTGLRNNIWWRWGRVQLIVALGLLPLVGYQFQQISAVSALTNIIAVPWVSMLSVPLITGGTLLIPISTTAAQFTLDMAIHSLALLWKILESGAAIHSSIVHIPRPSPGTLLMAVTGVIILLLPAGIPGRWPGLVILLPLIFPKLDYPETGQFRLTLLDVGQGQAAILLTRRHILVYDTGPRYSDSFNAGEDVVVPALINDGIDKIDLVIQGHGDNDHIGGLQSLLRAIPVDGVLTSVPEQVNHPHTFECTSGNSWDWDGVHLEILHPPAGKIFMGNNGSCVLKIQSDEYSVLITGDIERTAEQYLIRNYRDRLSANILIAPHHGSMTSSSHPFIGAVNPSQVIFSTGYGNRFGFPKQDIILRYRRRGIKVLDTARSGAIEVNITGTGIEIISYRQHLRRFWHTVD